MRSKLPVVIVPLLSLLCFAGAAFAEPSDKTVEADLRKSDATIKTVTFNTTRQGTTTWNAKAHRHEYFRSLDFVMPSKKDAEGIDVIVMGEAVYVKDGAVWRYDRFDVFGNRYLGLTDPTEEELKAVYEKAGPFFFFQPMLGRIVGTDVTWKLADKPDFVWKKPTSVELDIVAEYEQMPNALRVERVRQTFRLRLYRDAITDPWTTRCGTDKNCVSSSIKGKPEILSTRELARGEHNTIKTLGDILHEQQQR